MEKARKNMHQLYMHQLYMHRLHWQKGYIP
jgi:hypothetical protein